MGRLSSLLKPFNQFKRLDKVCVSQSVKLKSEKYAFSHVVNSTVKSLALIKWKTLSLFKMERPVEAKVVTITEVVRGLTELDRTLFKTTFRAPGLTVPVENIKPVIKILKPFMLKITKINPVVNTPDDTCDKMRKMILLRPEVECSEFTEEMTSKLLTYNVDMEFHMHDIVMEYVNWKTDEIIQAVLPKDVSNVGGFSIVGHIIHLNLRPEHEPFKRLIGQVLLDKNPIVKTVVNKTNSIDNVYRNFKMELLAGDDNMEVTLKEHGMTFKFDFSKVYWNSRLSTEHNRIVQIIKHGDIVFDVFGGVGPFAVPAAKKGAIVFANDLNPESYKWLQVNMTINKIKVDKHTDNLDGRQFIKDVVKYNMLKEWEKDEQSKMYVIMNLPALAIKFLDSFVGLFKDFSIGDFTKIEYPTVFCYCFSNADDKANDVAARVKSVLGLAVKKHQVRFVRNVAPNKDMMCARFQLNSDVLFGEGICNGEPPSKKVCTDECK